MALHRGARTGAGTKAKPLTANVRGDVSVSPHAHLLASDDWVLEAARWHRRTRTGYMRSLTTAECSVRGNQAYAPRAPAMVRVRAGVVPSAGRMRRFV